MIGKSNSRNKLSFNFQFSLWSEFSNNQGVAKMFSLGHKKTSRISFNPVHQPTKVELSGLFLQLVEELSYLLNIDTQQRQFRDSTVIENGLFSLYGRRVNYVVFSVFSLKIPKKRFLPTIFCFFFIFHSVGQISGYTSNNLLAELIARLKN